MDITGNPPFIVIACKVFQGLLERHFPAQAEIEFIYQDYGLHRVPAKLTVALQEQLDRIKPASLVILAYGLCGNGLNGLQAGKHTLLIPRADDCIAILMGSYECYRQQFELQPGTYYLTKGWLESGSDPLKEYFEAEAQYGTEQAQWIMDQQYQNYRRLVFIAHNPEDLEKYRARALKVAEYCQRWGMVYEEMLGSEAYIQRLAEVAMNLEALDDQFIIVSPGDELKQVQFFR